MKRRSNIVTNYATATTSGQPTSERNICTTSGRSGLGAERYSGTTRVLQLSGKFRKSYARNPADPQFIFGSSPDLPQDEILSRLLFGAPSGQLSPTQALALAQAAAIYSGGNDALEGLRRSLGHGAASNSNNSLNKLLGDRVSIGMHTGATPAQTGVGMSVTIYKQLKAKGAIDATGGAAVGVGAEYEW